MKGDIRKEVGSKIREIRIKSGLTQERLSELADIDYKYIQRIEGKNPPALKIDTIDRIARAFRVKPYLLMKF